MKTLLSSAFLILWLSTAALPTRAQQTPGILPQDVQIRIAVMAAPEDKRAEATVYGYSAKGEFIMLREGSNDFICLAPKAGSDESTLQAYAYPKSLDPFMARGRELIAQGKGAERDSIREAEIKAGKLFMPKSPTAFYGYSGKLENLDPKTGEIRDASRRYVIYIPYARAAELGLSNKPVGPGMPWLMAEGTYKAHIMITP